MRNLYNTLKGDYLQRSRSYAFLITLAITVYAAHSFVPTPDANYTTLTIPGYKGVYNSAWVGHVSALMTTVMLAFCGFYFVNGAIKKDIDTGVGQIIATTSVTNFRYLFIKFLGNFMILLTISGIALLVGIVMFFIQKSGSPFHIRDFLRPYFFMVAPSMFLVSGLAILAEVFLRGKTVLQNILYFFVFFFMILGMIRKNDSIGTYVSDSLGMGIITNSIKDQVNDQFNENIPGISIGRSVDQDKNFKTFVWNGVHWNTNYLLSRLIWIGLILLLIYLSSFRFHRFDFKQAAKNDWIQNFPKEKPIIASYAGFQRSALPPIVQDYGIIPFIKTELLLMIRKDSKWLWLPAFGLWVATLFSPLNIAYTALLPVIFFLQVSRLGDLATKEVTSRLHYFTFASYRPLQRILPAQILAAFCLLTVLALPVIVRLIFNLNFFSVIQLMNGALFVISLSVGLGILSGGKKLFEILFFLLTYINFQGSPTLLYLGEEDHHNYSVFTVLLVASILLLTLAFIRRRMQIRNL